MSHAEMPPPPLLEVDAVLVALAIVVVVELAVDDELPFVALFELLLLPDVDVVAVGPVVEEGEDVVVALVPEPPLSPPVGAVGRVTGRGRVVGGVVWTPPPAPGVVTGGSAPATAIPRTPTPSTIPRLVNNIRAQTRRMAPPLTSAHPHPEGSHTDGG